MFTRRFQTCARKSRNETTSEYLSFARPLGCAMSSSQLRLKKRKKETSATQDYMLNVSSIAKVILVRENDFISRSLGGRKVMFHSKTVFCRVTKVSTMTK